MNAEDGSELMAAKARESLASAEADHAAKRYNSCANRAYFACFQAAVSVFARQGISRADERLEHRVVARRFTEHFIIRRKVYPASLGGDIYWLMDRRHRADYRTESIHAREASQAIRMARRFVATVLQ